MLHHHDGEGLILITQPAHAWAAGQIARAWGNAEFGAFGPREEVCLAAEQHDLGWAEWERAPAFNPATGLPRAFLEMPRAAHLAIWTDGPERMLAQSRYAALLVSLHGAGLQREFGLKGTAEETAPVREYIAAQEAFQHRLAAMMEGDWRYREGLKPAALERNRRLVRAWDVMSLALFAGRRAEAAIERVPMARGETSLAMTPLDAARVAVHPWPFRGESATVDCEGRRCDRRFDNEDEMRRSLDDLPWVTLRIRLVPAG